MDTNFLLFENAMTEYKKILEKDNFEKKKSSEDENDDKYNIIPEGNLSDYSSDVDQKEDYNEQLQRIKENNELIEKDNEKKALIQKKVCIKALLN